MSICQEELAKLENQREQIQKNNIISFFFNSILEGLAIIGIVPYSLFLSFVLTVVIISFIMRFLKMMDKSGVSQTEISFSKPMNRLPAGEEEEEEEEDEYE